MLATRNPVLVMRNFVLAARNPMSATRAVGAKVYSLGQRPRYMTIKLFARYRRKSSEASNHGSNASINHYVGRYCPNYQPSYCDNAYGYFCACSAHCPRENDTWGVAPGYKLLRFQRALLAEASPRWPKWLWLIPKSSLKIKRPVFRLLMTAPSVLKMAPGNVKVGLHGRKVKE